MIRQGAARTAFPDAGAALLAWAALLGALSGPGKRGPARIIHRAHIRAASRTPMPED